MRAVTQQAVPDAGPETPSRSPNLMLALATIGFAVNFWAWALLSPLGPLFREQGTLGALSESDVALLVAVPVLVGGFFVGIGGTAFAIGVPFVNAWFPPERRGLAVGIFGAGMGGTAIAQGCGRGRPCRVAGRGLKRRPR